MFTARQNRRTASQRRKLFVESLEIRAVPATFNWVAGVPGDWDVAANWKDQDQLPGIPGAGGSRDLHPSRYFYRVANC